MDHLKRWLIRALFVAFLCAVFPVAQVLFVRFVNPPFTLTMVQRVIERGAAGEGWRWVDYQPVRVDVPHSNAAHAFVASEDARFFMHHGFDWPNICSALKTNSKEKFRGGSTISQQVAKNLFLWQHRSWFRKGLEVVYTGLLELLVPKERILELYLNVAETGPHRFGVQAASRHYFKKSTSMLSLGEAGKIAGLLPNPQHRSITGTEAKRRAQFVQKYPAPFPADRHFSRAVAQARGLNEPRCVLTVLLAKQ